MGEELKGERTNNDASASKPIWVCHYPCIDLCERTLFELLPSLSYCRTQLPHPSEQEPAIAH